MNVTVIIVNFNGREFTPSCIESLPAGVEIIVVDNGSSDGSADALVEAYPSITLIRNSVNRGFAAAVNQAMKKAVGRYFLLLNNDARLTPEALSLLTATMEKDPEIGMCAPQLLHEDGRRQHSFANLPTLATELMNKSLLRLVNPRKYPSKRQEYTDPRNVESVIGACMIVRRDLVDRIGRD